MENRNKYNFYKEELKRRYCYIYENTSFILAPFIRNNFSINIGKMDIDTLMMVEEILLSDLPLEETTGYKYFESLKEDASYLTKVKNTLRPTNVKFDNLKIELKIFNIFSQIYEFIDSQYIDLECRLKKLKIIDEYCRISRYTNDGKEWTSGYKINCKDAVLHNINDLSSNIPKKSTKILYEGIVNNSFIDYIINNYISLTQEERKQIYFKYHDEIPYDTLISCRYEYDSETLRPNITKPCRNIFMLIESEIFTDGEYFYQLCPNCGFIVKIDDELLSMGIKNRIIEKSCDVDYRIAYLKSELMKLENEKKKQLKVKKRTM